MWRFRSVFGAVSDSSPRLCSQTGLRRLSGRHVYTGDNLRGEPAGFSALTSGTTTAGRDLAPDWTHGTPSIWRRCSLPSASPGSLVQIGSAPHAARSKREWPMHVLPRHLSSALVGVLSVPIGIWRRVGEPVKSFGANSHSSPIGQMVQEASDMGYGRVVPVRGAEFESGGSTPH
jgi:hypothetical protein